VLGPGNTSRCRRSSSQAGDVQRTIRSDATKQIDRTQLALNPGVDRAGQRPVRDAVLFTKSAHIEKGRKRMIKLIAAAGFALAIATSAQAMTPAPLALRSVLTGGGLAKAQEPRARTARGSLAAPVNLQYTLG
jgi:hypothetical protein